MPHPIVGTWAFVASEWKRADGKHANPFGAGSTGILTYDDAGFMSVQIMHADRPATPNIPPTIDSAFASATPGYLAYFGTYEITTPPLRGGERRPVEDAPRRGDEGHGGIVTHTVIASTFPPFVGTQHRRRFAIDGDQLTLRDDLTTSDGVAVAAATMWRRA